MRVKVSTEKMDHHPDLHLTNYKKLTGVLTTHDAGDVTERDFKLAKKIQAPRKKGSKLTTLT